MTDTALDFFEAAGADIRRPLAKPIRHGGAPTYSKHNIPEVFLGAPVWHSGRLGHPWWDSWKIGGICLPQLDANSASTFLRVKFSMLRNTQYTRARPRFAQFSLSVVRIRRSGSAVVAKSEVVVVDSP